jgi:hypothetical protein
LLLFRGKNNNLVTTTRNSDGKNWKAARGVSIKVVSCHHRLGNRCKRHSSLWGGKWCRSSRSRRRRWWRRRGGAEEGWAELCAREGGVVEEGGGDAGVAKRPAVHNPLGAHRCFGAFELDKHGAAAYGGWGHYKESATERERERERDRERERERESEREQE